MYKKTEVKFNEVPNMIESLKGVSGLYIFHTHRHFWYVGKAECFRHRFVNGYLKGKNAKQYVTEGLQERIGLGLELSVVFVEIPKELIESEEARVIGKLCPWFNKTHNPRDSIRGIQSQMGEIVQYSQREWSYEEIKKHLFYYYSGQIATKRIEEALANKDGNLSKYYGKVRAREILKPK
ncbi:hypothetical protein ACIQXU_16650 [Peribacillus sp. NPDC097284]|uniref:hypothetical protein n=1 Tax=Peribacillus sp. NPDC097284 TaxID=3364401 RepID=UPI00380F55A3